MVFRSRVKHSTNQSHSALPLCQRMKILSSMLTYAADIKFKSQRKPGSPGTYTKHMLTEMNERLTYG